MFCVWLIELIFWLLIWKFWINVYDMWDIFVGLYLLIWAHLIDEICWINLKFGFGFEYLLWTLYIFRYLDLDYFCFCISSFCNFVGWVRIYDTWSMKFHEKSEIQKVVGRHWACYKFVCVHVLFFTTIEFYFH